MHPILIGGFAAVALLGAATAIGQGKSAKAETVHVVLLVKAKPDQIEALRTLLAALVAPTQAEEGCISYELFHNRADPTDFAFIEEWTSHAALDAHMQTRHVQAALGAVGPLIVGALDQRRYVSTRRTP